MSDFKLSVTDFPKELKSMGLEVLMDVIHNKEIKKIVLPARAGREGLANILVKHGVVKQDEIYRYLKEAVHPLGLRVSESDEFVRNLSLRAGKLASQKSD